MVSGFFFLKRHLAIEGKAFATSIERKFGPRRAAGEPAQPGVAADRDR